MLNELQSMRVLIVEDQQTENNMMMSRAIDRLCEALESRGVETVRVASYAEAYPVASTDMDLDCFLISTDMNLNKDGESCALHLLEKIKTRQSRVPVFLLADRERTARALSPELMERASEFAWIFEDSPEFIAGRIVSAAQRFRNGLLPPLMKAIWKYNEENHEYSWAAPGHQGGIGFTKSPEGKKFFDFYGENLFRTDTGIERSSIGSLLDHTGAFAESERFASKVFGSDHSWSVVVGTSGSNRTIMQAVLSPESIAVCDRNCHKSIEQGLILTGAAPVYMLPSRNRYGIIGPIRHAEMTPEAIAGKIRASPLISRKDARAGYAVVTNCTYDGICYHAGKVFEELDRSVDHIHFDEAWYAYARFHPVYHGHYAMQGDPSLHKGATLYATHSTHKLLNALSQASYIHVRDGRGAIDPDRFNQAYMLHATTSPLYAICASNDISSAMMHSCGESLIREVIAEAVDFRQATARLYREFTKKGSWFFKPWNKEIICDKEHRCEFADAPREMLIRDQKCWKIENGETWHGFHDLDCDWVMLDPIKVSILTPGMGDDGRIQEHGVPAALVSYYLYQEGIVPTRTTDFQIMFLFSMGTTRGKWGTLLNTLLNFRKHYEANTPVSEVLPGLVSAHREMYGRFGLRDLGERMFGYLREKNPGALLNEAFSSIPEPAMLPRTAYMKIVDKSVEFVPSCSLNGRITANSVIPYPPGIPLLMSGERFGGKESPQIRYLQALEAWDREFPGFEHETEGSKVIDGVYHVLCVKE